MTLKGHIEKGSLVLDQPVELPDGVNVEVEVRPVADSVESGPTWAQVFGDLIGSVDGLPPDMAENHDHYIHGTPKGIDKR